MRVDLTMEGFGTENDFPHSPSGPFGYDAFSCGFPGCNRRKEHLSRRHETRAPGSAK
jgi:hypothetical protein